MPLPITLAPDPVHLVSCTQHTSVFLLCNVSTTSADLPDIVPMFQVANCMQSGTLEVFFRPPPPASLQGIRSRTFIMTGTPSCSLTVNVIRDTIVWRSQTCPLWLISYSTAFYSNIYLYRPSEECTATEATTETDDTNLQTTAYTKKMHTKVVQHYYRFQPSDILRETVPR